VGQLAPAKAARQVPLVEGTVIESITFFQKVLFYQDKNGYGIATALCAARQYWAKIRVNK